jgi:putative SOS response-associated peptidase YedK
MCGRFALFHSAEAIAEAFQVELMDLPPRYNIAPSQPVAAIALLWLALSQMPETGDNLGG